MNAVLLDAAGTLFRPRRPVGEIYAATARRFGMELDADRLSQAFTAVFADMPALAFDPLPRDELRRAERSWWRTLVGIVVDAAGERAGNFDAFFDDLYGYYARGSAWTCYPEVPAVLRALRDRGNRLAVVSNFDSRLPGILRDLGLRDRFDAVVYSSEAGSAKPDPAIFKQALEALGVVPAAAIHVGDSQHADVAGAAAAGIRGLLIRHGKSHPPESESVIGSLHELLHRLDGSNR